MRKRSDKAIGLIGGFVLGLGAPVGACLLKGVLTGHFPHASWVEEELSGHSYFYLYMTLTTPLVFMGFGGYLGTLSDKARSQNQVLEYLMSAVQKASITDEATGIHNRRHLFDILEKEVGRATRFNHPLSGIMIDLDNFKQINDRYGHPAGDRVLSELANILIKSIRNIDTVGRYGGDEFLIVLPETKQEGALKVAERILQNIRDYRPKSREGPESVSASVGVISFETAADLTSARFLDAVDRALLQAKSSGKNRISRSPLLSA